MRTLEQFNLGKNNTYTASQQYASGNQWRYSLHAWNPFKVFLRYFIHKIALNQQKGTVTLNFDPI